MTLARPTLELNGQPSSLPTVRMPPKPCTIVGLSRSMSSRSGCQGRRRSSSSSSWAVSWLTSQCRRPRGWRVLILVDSEAAEGALVKGYNSLEDISDLIGVFWLMALHWDLSVYIGRVPSDAKSAESESGCRMRDFEERGATRVTPHSPCELRSRTDWAAKLEEWTTCEATESYR